MKQYLGYLPGCDPLYHYLRYDIQPQVNWCCGEPGYRVYRLNGSNDVYLYEEVNTGTQMIGKFFLSRRERNPDHAARRMNREYDCLSLMRGFGFTGWPHYIARPLGRNGGLNMLLMVEFCHGEVLSRIIRRSIRERNDGLLFGKLSALAYFLAHFHNDSATECWRVDFSDSSRYLDCVACKLRAAGILQQQEADELYDLSGRWYDKPAMWEDCQVLIHGDATPENFMFGDGPSVISYDLERIKRADRVADTGRIAGELMHFFMEECGDPYAAERFIGHFLWEYACHFPDRERAFEATTRRVPYYMGTTLLRIARNGWLDWEYRRRLIYHGMESLRKHWL